MTISYLTESVIKESQKLFDEQEKQKHIKEQNRLEKSAKSKENGLNHFQLFMKNLVTQLKLFPIKPKLSLQKFSRRIKLQRIKKFSANSISKNINNIL